MKIIQEKTLIREILEEVKGINNKDINVSKQPVFTKRNRN